MPQADNLLSLLGQVAVLPQQLLLDTPGVRATVPMLRGAWGAALHGLDPAAYHTVFAPDGRAATPGYLLRPAPPDPATAPSVQWFLFGAALAQDEVLRRAWDVASGM